MKRHLMAALMMGGLFAGCETPSPAREAETLPWAGTSVSWTVAESDAATGTVILLQRAAPTYWAEAGRDARRRNVATAQQLADKTCRKMGFGAALFRATDEQGAVERGREITVTRVVYRCG